MINQDKIAWIDVETTGLDAKKHLILELAIVITDYDCNILVEPKSWVVFYPPNAISAIIDDWCLRTHTKNGLLAESQVSALWRMDVEQAAYTYLADHLEPNKSPIGGFSVGFDRNFLEQHMPKTIDHLHYRNIDVSSIRELVKRWVPEFAGSPSAQSKHRALDDCLAAIEQLRKYKATFFNKGV